MSAYDNYPPGTWAGDPMAPWNREDEPEDAEEVHAIREGVRELYDELMREVRSDDPMQV